MNENDCGMMEGDGATRQRTPASVGKIDSGICLGPRISARIN